MEQLKRLWQKETLRVIGLMSGTSADGMDAALVDITGYGLSTKVTTLGFVSVPYPEKVRNEILHLASGEEKEISQAELAAIDPATIESMEVLKDAESTAKYGDKGKNGVVVLNLKRSQRR